MELSASTAPGGSGADGYARSLAADFSRWTVGSTVIDRKEDWVDGIRQWFEDGWRVSGRKVQHLEITVVENVAFARRIVQETYLGPQGDRTEATAAVAEVWFRQKERWLLLRVDVQPMAAP